MLRKLCEKARKILIFSAAAIPDSLPPLRYFLEEINTPLWHWRLRTAFILAVLLLGSVLLVGKNAPVTPPDGTEQAVSSGNKGEE